MSISSINKAHVSKNLNLKDQDKRLSGLKGFYIRHIFAKTYWENNRQGSTLEYQCPARFEGSSLVSRHSFNINIAFDASEYIPSQESRPSGSRSGRPPLFKASNRVLAISSAGVNSASKSCSASYRRVLFVGHSGSLYAG